MAMSTPSSSLFLLLLLLVAISGFVGARELHGFKPRKLFVFGDSYADTGNFPRSFGGSWSVPYGSTHPGKPAGRFSDGIILTDYLAKFLRLHSPLTYARRDSANRSKNGMNFAFGGSGVFLTLPGLPNVTSQIDFFQELLTTSYYTNSDVRSAAFLVTLAGNDYSAYVRNGGSLTNITVFIQSVVNQLVTDLKRIQQLGALKIIVAGIEPLGCLPSLAEPTGYSSCDNNSNSAASYHNSLLRQAVDELNNNTSTPTFLLLDFYHAFQTVITTGRDYKGNLRFTAPLRPCCQWIGRGNSCGSVDANGTALYTVCSDPGAFIFWDGVHPTQAGWRTVFKLVQRNIGQFLRL